jgi:hypothetical protein
MGCPLEKITENGSFATGDLTPEEFSNEIRKGFDELGTGKPAG